MREAVVAPEGLLMTAVLEEGAEHPLAVRIGWSGPLRGGRAVAVWVDGLLASWTGVSGSTGLWVLMDRTIEHYVEVREVSLEDLLEGRVRPPVADALVVLRDERWPVDAWVVFSGNGVRLSRRVWADGVGRGGFGSRFGTGAFGIEGEGGPGLGGGSLGWEPLGSGGVPQRLGGCWLRVW